MKGFYPTAIRRMQPIFSKKTSFTTRNMILATSNYNWFIQFKFLAHNFTFHRHIQCGRRADVFKFWYMWRAKGSNGLEQHVNQVFESAEYFTSIIKNRAGFELVLENPECTNICFFYVPPSLKNAQRDQEFKSKLHKVAPKIKEKMMKEGSMMITYQPLREKPNFFRLVLQNSALNKDDMMHFVNEIERLGADLWINALQKKCWELIFLNYLK